MSWPEWFAAGIPQRLAEQCSSMAELAEAVSDEVGQRVTAGALDNARRRHRHRFGLPERWSDLFAEQTNPCAALGIEWNQDNAKARQEARSGWSPDHDMTHPVPDGYFVKGVSTYYDRDGEVRGQWVKSTADSNRLQMLADVVASIAEPFRGASDVPPRPQQCNDDLLCVYPMGDPHLGMYSWAEETGNDFDLAIAERNLVAAVDHLVGLAPSASQALIVNLGDFFHADNQSNTTSRSGHALDVDTRWGKVMKVGIRTMRRCIDRAAEKHDEVRVVCEIGNHDDHSAIMLALSLDMFYENNPRVVIDTSPSPFHWHRFGANLIGITHGNGVKARDLPNVMACDRPQDWGDTRHRYWYTGHVHHDSLKEYPGVVVETFRTLAGRDAWHHAQGYRSGRDMKCDVLHREHGRINRHIVGIEQIVEAA